MRENSVMITLDAIQEENKRKVTQHNGEAAVILVAAEDKDGKTMNLNSIISGSYNLSTIHSLIRGCMEVSKELMNKAEEAYGMEVVAAMMLDLMLDKVGQEDDDDEPSK